MKFGKTLFRNQIPEWTRHYLSYKGLKKEIKNGQVALSHGELSMDDVVTAFVFHLDREVEKVNSFFLYKRSELERRLRILTEKSRRLGPSAGSSSTTITPAAAAMGNAAKSRLDLSIVTSPKGSTAAAPASSTTPLVAPSPFISDPEADAECLHAMLQTKEMLSKITWFATMNRRAVEKILKKFDKRMSTVCREDYLTTKVNLLPFVTDGQLLEMAVATDVLIREMSAVVADHPPAKLGMSPQQTSEARLGLTESETDEAVKAIEQDDVETLKRIIEDKIKENPKLKDIFLSSAKSGRVGQLPRALFRKACQERAFQCIAYLMSFGAGTLMVNVNEQTVLHKLAIEGGVFSKSQDSERRPNIGSLLPEKTPENVIKAPKDDPALISFILNQISSYASTDSLCALKSTADIFGRRPLHYAAMYGFTNITRALLNDLKATGEFVDFSSPYWLDTDGFSPLIYAVTRGQAGVLRILIEEGGITDVDTVTNVCAITPSIPKIMPTTPLTVLNPLVGSEANLHAAYTYTPLSIACRLGHVEATKLLIQCGANLDAQDEDGESCLIIAAKSGHVECVKLLLAGSPNGKGADMELRERYYGWTALHLAAIENHPDVVKVLLAAGANPNVYDFSSWNAHEHAVFAANNVCAAILRPVSRTLDERQQLQRDSLLLGEPLQGSPTKANFSGSQAMLPTLSSGSTGSGGPILRADSPPVSGGKNGVKLSKTVHRAYGHKYLEGDSLIVVTLGSNDIRNTAEPVELFHTGSDNSFLTASTAFSLEITSENATAGEKVIIDLPLKDARYQEQIVFYSANPEETILNFSVYPTFGHSSDKLVGRGTAMLSSLDNLRKDVSNHHPRMTPLQGMNMTVPIFGVDSMTIIGRVRVEFSVVRPFQHENLRVGSKHTYWKSLTTTVIGHRGLGMNRKVSNLQVGENTLLSFVTAASLGAEYVEFDVQMTKDLEPVLYHDWTVTETGLDIPVSSITVDQFRKLSTKSSPRNRHGSTSSTPTSPRSETTATMPGISITPPPSKSNGTVNNVSNDNALDRSELPRRSSHQNGSESPGKEGGRLGRSNSLGAMAKLKSLSTVSEPVDPSAKMKGNGLGTIQAPFATLKETFQTVPSHIGFNIEVKYPMLDEAEDANIPLYSFELNLFVDRILQEVYDHDQTHPDRNIIFSSFHPDICLLLNMKQPNYPVFFLTDGGTSVLADRRCNSIQGAVRFASSIDLLGIVTHSDPILEAPNLVKGIKESGLLVFTYGAGNNDVDNAKLQRRHGVDAVIVDCVLAVRKGLQQAD
ncbi:glycerophosphodiester phosphodiesterase [Entomortierella parvispora]|uniref:Glycerophosphodiester phosphodiesterase n=1 Tax=Entomortierella parvispora TaxID=205924 RepID=A0A9P3H6B6_9FUNG|nr:glycerophosphodiester phosphodiesterase [Entomortierella parvispora]